MNKVIAGDYKDENIIHASGDVYITTSILKPLLLSKENIESYEVITDEHRKSAASAISRGLIGGIAGPAGILGGALSAKNIGTYRVAIQFKDGKQSLIEINEKIYKKLVQNLF